MKSFILGLSLIALAGCTSTPKGARLVDGSDELPSIKAEKSDVLSKLNIGMSLKDFKVIFPEAYVGGQNRQTTAYEYVHVQKYVTQADMDRHFWVYGVGSPNARTKKEILWFYFFSNKLVKWGGPNDWPERPDLILETRVR